jgi:CRP-like cAMP-binding protein
MKSEVMPHLALMLRKLEQWVIFDENDREALLALPSAVRPIAPKKFLVREGDKVDRCCLLLSGFALRHKVVADGGRQIVSLHMAGDIVDLQNVLLKISDHNVQALTQCAVAFIPRQMIRQIAFERPSVGEAMWLDTLVDASIFREWIANVGRRDARSRIAHLLCEFGLRLRIAGLGDQNGYELPMTQEDIGDCTGLTGIHVNRTLRSLADDGLIVRTLRSVKIVDWNALATAGDFRSGYLHSSTVKLTMT